MGSTASISSSCSQASRTRPSSQGSGPQRGRAAGAARPTAAARTASPRATTPGANPVAKARNCAAARTAIPTPKAAAKRSSASRSRHPPQQGPADQEHGQREAKRQASGGQDRSHALCSTAMQRYGVSSHEKAAAGKATLPLQSMQATTGLLRSHRTARGIAPGAAASVACQTRRRHRLPRIPIWADERARAIRPGRDPRRSAGSPAVKTLHRHLASVFTDGDGALGGQRFPDQPHRLLDHRRRDVGDACRPAPGRQGHSPRHPA